MNKAEEFKDFAINFFDKTRKTGWGKKEVSRQILGLWSEFLMKHVRDQQKQAEEEFKPDHFNIPKGKEPSDDATAPSERKSTTAIDELTKELEAEGDLDGATDEIEKHEISGGGWESESDHYR